MAFIAVCLGVITLAVLALLGFALYVFWQVRRAAAAVEALAYTARDQFGRLRGATDRLSEFAGLASSGWAKALAIGLGTAAAFWMRRRARSCD
jgi:hypothetical protein